MPRHSTQTPNALVASPEVRRYIYRLFLAAGPLLLFYGVVRADELALWSGLAGTALGVPTGVLALANVPKP